MSIKLKSSCWRGDGFQQQLPDTRDLLIKTLSASTIKKCQWTPYSCLDAAVEIHRRASKNFLVLYSRRLFFTDNSTVILVFVSGSFCGSSQLESTAVWDANY